MENAVRCGKCGRNNPRVSNNCTSCGKKLDLADQLVYDKKFEKNSERPARSSPTTLMMYALVFGALFLFLLNILGVGTRKPSPTLTKTGLENPKENEEKQSMGKL